MKGEQHEWHLWEAESFHGDIFKWSVSRVTDVRSMFTRATSFCGDISKWDVSSVINMDHMFMKATSFKTGCLDGSHTVTHPGLFRVVVGARPHSRANRRHYPGRGCGNHVVHTVT